MFMTATPQPRAPLSSAGRTSRPRRPQANCRSRPSTPRQAKRTHGVDEQRLAAGSRPSTARGGRRGLGRPPGPLWSAFPPLQHGTNKNACLA